jgi:LytR cell envelope-related transcriptional attenuator
VPVAVLNATSATGVARSLAQQLHPQGVTIATVGNLGSGRPPGWEILYAPGAQNQATRLAALLASHSPTVGPMDATTSAAAGTAARLVVIIG